MYEFRSDDSRFVHVLHRFVNSDGISLELFLFSNFVWPNNWHSFLVPMLEKSQFNRLNVKWKYTQLMTNDTLLTILWIRMLNAEMLDTCCWKRNIFFFGPPYSVFGLLSIVERLRYLSKSVYHIFRAFNVVIRVPSHILYSPGVFSYLLLLRLLLLLFTRRSPALVSYTLFCYDFECIRIGERML